MSREVRPRNWFEKNLAQTISSTFPGTSIDYGTEKDPVEFICQFELERVLFVIFYRLTYFVGWLKKSQIIVRVCDPVTSTRLCRSVHLRRKSIYCPDRPLWQWERKYIAQLEAKNKAQEGLSPISRNRLRRLQSNGDAQYRDVGRFVYIVDGSYEHIDTSNFVYGKPVVLLDPEGAPITDKLLVQTVQKVVTMLESVPVLAEQEDD